MKLLDEHNCKTLERQSTIAVSKREINSKVRWCWEREDKTGIHADEIKFCPYCGEELK